MGLPKWEGVVEGVSPVAAQRHSQHAARAAPATAAAPVPAAAAATASPPAAVTFAAAAAPELEDMAEGGAADLETQRSDIAALLKTALRKGDTWYLVDSRWFKQWKKYVGFDSWDKYQMGDQNVYPGPIDNSGLLKDGDCQYLKEHLIDELDYILLPTEGWNKLVSWYTLLEGQEPIARKVVEQGMFVKHCKVEVYLTELKLCENGNMNNIVTRRFSKADTIDTIEKEIRKTFSIPDEKETRLWNKYMSNTFEPLNKPDSTIQDAGLYQGQWLLQHPDHHHYCGTRVIHRLPLRTEERFGAEQPTEPRPLDTDVTPAPAEPAHEPPSGP
ncbi:ubiquitin carboxyl-terminal hydrolase 15 isoform X7 [Crotalus tigris]|uniref:ubiquitin carboxyl-terminal hydrolase 15 isoform X7 n=1 Tax=Crotalus tigris TaxID=88082 RepID=UPI00192F36E7|nr:ubiquitin carboxyl-terminal hydrolase 15 isoform X7 [Crotalus tigris]